MQYFYRSIKIENLEEIQQQVLDCIPVNLLTYSNLTYIENNKKIFLGIEPLKEFLSKNKILPYVGTIAINITKGCLEGNYHIDSGPYHYSLNIPISGCDNTWINFYETNSPHTVVTVKNEGKEHFFFRFTEDQCKLIHKEETKFPYLLGVKYPHRVENKTNDTRIMLLIRLYPGFEPSSI